ncbi:MAG TPA: hypothetical protein PLU87_14990 [Sedimentisphaerales bacterium]|nr:hypothetical protein [Sedimentisphaerales bacterium]HRS12455.1 hypothetical protein [Sedimentisphaerales bacterium]HRV49102.1 hypothetical protein [Sedimentisphaerales bacterium]
MDNLGNNSNTGNPVEKPIPFDNAEKATPPGSPAPAAPGVSRAPLNLGGAAKPAAAAPATTAAAPTAATTAAPAPRPAAPVPVRRPAPEVPTPSGGRITAVKTFFTKLHPGALEFMDEQIGAWLKEHPEVHIKHTNITTGEVQAKKTEPNIIITLWY